MAVANVQRLANKHTISGGGQQCHKVTDVIWVNQQWTMVLILLMTKTCLSPQWPLPPPHPPAGCCQRSQCEDAAISWLLVSAVALALMEEEMKERRDGETGRLVSSPPAEEMLIELRCGNVKAGSYGLGRTPTASLARCQQRGLWEITRDQSWGLMPSSSRTFSSRNRVVGWGREK